jgi:hypothetical protein
MLKFWFIEIPAEEISGNKKNNVKEMMNMLFFISR